MMIISIIIPTSNRSEQLLNLINDILSCDLTHIRDIIIIDENRDDYIIRSLFNIQKKANIKYFSAGLKSSSRSRNFGAYNSSGNLLIFFDDDIRIYDKNVFNKISNIFTKDLDVKLLGILPKRDQNISRSIYEIIRCIFLFNHPYRYFHLFFTGRNGGYINIPKRKIFQAKWIEGCSLCIRKEIFDIFKFEEKFLKYSFGEDVLLSHQVFKNYGSESVKYLTDSEIIHLKENVARISNEDRIIMEHSYRLYICQQLNLIPVSLINNLLWRILMIWGIIGDILFVILVDMIKNKRIDIDSFKNSFFHLKYSLLSLKFIEELKDDPNFIRNRYNYM